MKHKGWIHKLYTSQKPFPTDILTKVFYQKSNIEHRWSLVEVKPFVLENNQLNMYIYSSLISFSQMDQMSIKEYPRITQNM